MNSKKKIFYLKTIINLFLYYLIGCFVERENTELLLTLFFILFYFQFFFLNKEISLKEIFFLGICFRLTLLFSIPKLSQDFYRFLWDGNIQILGINPYLYKPQFLNNLVVFPLSDLFFQNMGDLSSNNFSNYPPISQYLYRLAAYFNNGGLMNSVIFLKFFYLISEVMIFFTGIRLLKNLNQNSKNIGWYFLNPLVIIEIIGNLHGESLMIMFMLLSFFYLFQKRIVLGSFFMALSIGTKLLPILIIPLFYKFIGLRRFFHLVSTLILFSVIIWVPFFNHGNASNYMTTIALWFNTFEFNASLYYIIRFIGYELKGYNIIKGLAVVTPFLIILMILLVSFIRKNDSSIDVLKSSLLLFSLYLFTATTVHPWYIINLVILSVFTGHIYPVIWSLTSLWSYSGYNKYGFEEQNFWLFLEYFFLYSFFLYEILKRPLLNHIQKINFVIRKIPPISSG